MKRLLLFLILGLGFLPGSSPGAVPAQVRMRCLSLNVQSAVATDSYGFRWRISLTTLSSGDNGELAPDFFGSGYTHSAYLDIYSELNNGTDPGAMALDVPDGGDANGNGLPDFWEVSQGVNGLSSSGVIQSQSLGINYNLSAKWYRDPGTTTGTCVMTFPDPENPFNKITFTHSFEVLEYTGLMDYTPGATAVSSTVNLVQTGHPEITLQGPMNFTKTPGDLYNSLTLESVLLTNADQLTLDLFTTTDISRETTLQTNYSGLVDFIDYDLTTPDDDDYYTWKISIDDPNDSDSDTIPNFSDDPQTTLPRQPLLALTPTGTNFLLTVSGDVGHICHILEAASLTSPNWITNQTFTLTSDPQTVLLPLSGGGAKFWRVQTE
ncbi:MAG TPA: hypothetical protein VL527_06675 [Dongiaceae bacterium]|nr:hypothetical protein [Dongiaceae bacterium]